MTGSDPRQTHRMSGPQTPADRRQLILDLVRENGYTGAAELAASLHVDSSTVRRDLERLERSGMIRRTHGGAVPADPIDSVDTPYEVRRAQNAAAKRAIGETAAALVRDGETVLIDNGSTTYQVAAALSHHRGLTVVTNDLMVAMCLRAEGNHQVHLTGGLLLDTVYTLVGPSATRSIENLHVDWAFLGAEGIDGDAGVTNINVVEIPVKQAMIHAAKHVAVVADHSKFGRTSLAAVCGLDELDAVITDSAPADELAHALGSKLHIAEPQPIRAGRRASDLEDLTTRKEHHD